VSTKEIARLLEEAAAHVPPPQLAEASWAGVVRARRRRRVAVGGSAFVAAALVAAIAIPLAGRPATVAPPGSPASTAATPPVDRVLPQPPDRYDVRLPRSTTDLADAKVLAAGSLVRADALFEPAPSAEQPRPVYALFDGVPYRLDVPLRWVTLGERQFSPPLRPGSLSPDGRRAAFPQPDAVVIVDLRTAVASTIPLPGLNEDVLWHDARSVVVAQAGRAFLVDAVNGQASGVAARFDPADTLGGQPLVELPPDIGSGLTLREWEPTEGSPRRTIAVDQRDVRPYAVTGWSGPAHRSVGLIVRAAVVRSPDGPGTPAVAVVERGSGRVVRLLLADRPGADWGAPLGWLDAHTVLLRQDVEGLITWDTRSGMTGSVRALPGTFAFAPF
jgi:hypothetical protein